MFDSSARSMRWSIPFGSRWLLLVTLLVSTSSAGIRAQGADSVGVELSRRVTAGDRVGVRTVTDSLLKITSPESALYPELLYWHAATATSAADAERDYVRLTVEYPLSVRAPDALLHLAQLEYARRDRIAARRHFDQLLREHPTGPFVAKASYWSARLALEDGDSDRACLLFATARSNVAELDVELRNQIDYYTTQCAAAAQKDSAAAHLADADVAAKRDSSVAARASGPEFSIQIAAFATKRDATALAAQLRHRGYDSRVVGAAAPFRVRVGRFASREAAMPTLARIKRGNPRAILVGAEPR
jgi:cell division septation protein DedD